MKIVTVQQGSQEWLDLRAKHDTASEAPAAAGVSKHTKRSELMRQKYTGEAPEVTPAQRRIFDRGHAAEADARPMAEEIIGEELYPITGISVVHPRLLASLDGATMLEDVIWEHKLWNDDLAAAVHAGELDEHYKVQMDQQLLVSGAERCLFMVSDGTWENCAWCWHEADQARFDKLLAVWRQFRADLKEYTPEPQAVAPEGKALGDLPDLQVELTGAVQASNLPEFKNRALAMIEGIKTELVTDQDFADADKAVKGLKKGENQLADNKQAALEQTASINDLFATIDELRESMRQKRLQLEKLVKAEKQNRRAEIQRQAEQGFATWLDNLDSPVKPRTDLDVAGATKGKKTLASLKDAADDEVARAKTAATQEAARLNQAALLLKGETRHYEFLFADRDQLLHKPLEDLTATIKARIADHQAAENKRQEAERERIRQEEEAKAKAEAERQAQQEKPQEPEQPESELQRIDPNDAGMGYERKPIDTSCISAAADHFQRGSEIAGPETVEITRKEYDRLLASQAKLDALEAAGVDNWQGYPEAMDLLEKTEAA